MTDHATSVRPLDPPVTASAPPAPTGGDGRAERARRAVAALRLVAIAACVPYLGLKTAWLAGSHVGIPEGSELTSGDGQTMLYALNLLTVVMDAAVIVLVLALTQPWGRRLPAVLTLAPLWVATGLLAPIVLGFPATLLADALGGGGGGGDVSGTGSDGEPALDAWVFTVVYTGFSVQALALGGLFAFYVRARWSPVLRGRLAELPLPARRTPAVAALLTLLVPFTVHLLWLAGSTVGLNDAQREQDATSFHVVEATEVLFVLTAAAAVVLLALRPARFASPRLASARFASPRLGTVVATAWISGSALACWGGWMLLTNALTFPSAEPGERSTPLALLTYAGQMIAGLLVLALLARPLAERWRTLVASRTA
ncbi:hypothetical protein ACTWP5_03425 [Streptomyces sp. 4N509B]|uniref:hypothetical protein n=1 Tax=Streptomyces sp. 4N509B TaxID=3457413 RepID=UPI003FD4B2A4